METTPTPKGNAGPTTSETTQTMPANPAPALEAAQKAPGGNPPTPPPSSASASQGRCGPPDPKASKTSWTIMVYIAADAVLANFGVESLKQLNEAARSAPADGDTATVVVASQFSIDAPGGQTIPRYIFNRCSGGNLGSSLKGHLHAAPNMTEQEALADFLDWVYKRP